MAKRKKYTDKFKAGAILMLETEGYPDDPYAIERVAQHLDMPRRTLLRWFKGDTGAPADETVQEQKMGLIDLFDQELRQVFRAMNDVRSDASYRDLATGAGIFADKLQLLQNKPTQRIEHDVNQSELVDMNDDELADLLETIHARRQGEGETDSLEGGA